MLIPKQTALSDRLLEYLDFLRLQAIAGRDKEFLSSHKKDWYHGVSAPFTLVKYAPFDAFNKAHFGRTVDSEIYLNPHITLEKVSLPHADTRSSSLDSLSKSEEETLKYTELFKRDWDASSFSGYFQLPKFSYSRHQQPTDPNFDIDQFCYQNHFDVDKLTIMFGGLVVNASQSLKNLGIPRLTDLSRISVYFPCDLPPHINKDVLMSPCVMPNPDMILFDAMKGTVQASSIDSCSDVHPGNICAMEGTMISDSHMFYCGGFEVVVDKVEYRDEINRWLVHKSIRLNEHGYILNTRTKRFTKVIIKSNSETHYDGAIGNAMVSNRMERASLQTNCAALPNPLAHYQSEASLSEDATPTAEDILLSPNLPGTSTPTKFSPERPQVKEPNPSLAKHRQPGDASHNQISGGSLSSSGILRSSTPTSSRNISRINTEVSRKSLSRASDPRSSNTNLSPSSSSTDSSLKMTSMLMKSARIFHRNHHNHAFGHSQGSQSLGIGSTHYPAQHISSIRARSPSPVPGQQNTYSDQVRQHRSKPPLSANSTASASPARHMTQSPVRHSSDIAKTRSNSSGNDERISPNDVPTSADKPRIDTSHHGSDLMNNPERNLSPDDSASIDSSPTVGGSLVAKDSATDTGVLSVTVYLFGGFVRYLGEDNRTYFKATNDLLRLELIVEDSLSEKFHHEALICDATDTSNCKVWPTCRGFFAKCLIKNSSASEFCSLQLNHFQKISDESSKSQLFSPDASQNGISASEKSVKSSTYTFDLYLKNRCLLIQGGVDENNVVCSDVYIFNFSTYTWHKQQSFAFDYYNEPKQPFEDEVCEKLSLERASKNAPLVEAELRACHHHALLYEQDSKEYVLFVGGFNNDYLRHFDREPYVSDRFDVSRLARFSLTTSNPNLLRVPALNLQTQTWVFMRFFFDLRESISSKAMDMLMGNPNFRNLRMALNGGGCSIMGKQITWCHGLVNFVSEKAEDFDKYKQEIKSNVVLTGCHCHLSFPSM